MKAHSWNESRFFRTRSKPQNSLANTQVSMAFWGQLMLEEVASVIESSVFIRSKPRHYQTHKFQKLFGVDSACWEEVTSFIPRSVLSLVPSDTIAKHTTFNVFLGLTHHVGKRWLLSFQDKLISLHPVWIKSNVEFFHQILTLDGC